MGGLDYLARKKRKDSKAMAFEPYEVITTAGGARVYQRGHKQLVVWSVDGCMPHVQKQVLKGGDWQSRVREWFKWTFTTGGQAKALKWFEDKGDPVSPRHVIEMTPAKIENLDPMLVEWGKECHRNLEAAIGRFTQHNALMELDEFGEYDTPGSGEPPAALPTLILEEFGEGIEAQIEEFGAEITEEIEEFGVN